MGLSRKLATMTRKFNPENYMFLTRRGTETQRFFEHGKLGKNGNFRFFREFRVHKSENIKQKNALRLRKLPNGIKLLLRSIKWGGYKKRKWLAP